MLCEWNGETLECQLSFDDICCMSPFLVWIYNVLRFSTDLD